MRFRHLPLISIVFLTLNLSAFTDFRYGFVIDLKQDTIFGEIDYRQVLRNAQICKLRLGEEIIDYSAKDIHAYGVVNDRFFVTGIFEGKFVEVIVAGKMSLYYYNDDYYIDAEGYELYRVGALRGIEKEATTQEIQHRWKGNIIYRVAGCQEAIEMAHELEIKERSLVELVIAFNNCQNVQYVDYKQNRPWKLIEFGVYAGYNNTGLYSQRARLSGDLRHIPEKAFSNQAAFGLTMIFSSPRLYERLSLQAGLLFSRVDLSSYSKLEMYQRTEFYETMLVFNCYSLPVEVRYLLLPGRQPLFVKLGAIANYNTGIRSKVLSEHSYHIFNPGQVVIDFPQEFPMNAFSVGTLTGLGMQKSSGGWKTEMTIGYNVNFLFNSVTQRSLLNQFSIGVAIVR